MSKILRHEDIAEGYYKKYRPQIDALLASNSLRDIGESLTVDHVVMVGRQLDAFGLYTQSIGESYNTVGTLGKLPEVALDVITAAYGNSVLPLLASTQPIEEQKGLVYFREVRATADMGGFKKNGVISSPLGLNNPGDGTLGAQRKQVEVGKVATGTQDYTTTVNMPVRPYTVEVHIEGLGTGKDDGNGKLLTWGGYAGEVNYETGEIKVHVDTEGQTSAANKPIMARFDVEVDAAKSIDKIQAGLVTREVDAEIWTLAADIGFFATFAAGKRFGRSNADMVAEDLTNALVNSIDARIIKTIAGMAKGSITWNQNPPEGVSGRDHKDSFVDAIAAAEATLHRNAGSVAINRYVAGTSAAAVLRGMPGFTLATSVPGQSVSLYGFLDGVPVIRATNVVDDKSIFAVSNPTDYFNAPVAYCPYMPLMLTDTIQDAANPFKSTRAAGVWAGVAPMNENLVTEIKVETVTKFGKA